jgi:hypothetical protein
VRRARLRPVRLHLGPVTLTLLCLVFVGLLALVYLSQVAAVASANQRLQALQAEGVILRRQDDEAHARLGAAQNPEYVRKRAAALGLVPFPPGAIQVIVVPAPTATTGTAGGQP